eukprot:m.82694 g.82694  ORF g.82694 m.82694 type:complete len:265 (-) comp12885_c0_seq2:1654-2448(-)
MSGKPQNELIVCTTLYEKVSLVGFDCMLEPGLQEKEPELLKELEDDLMEIKRLVPEKALEILRNARIYFNEQLIFGEAAAPTTGRGMCHHQSEDWLAEHGNQPEKAGCVECYRARDYMEWRREQPSILLHELSHHLHFVIGPRADEIILRTFKVAQKSGKYESVAYCRGNKKMKHYALTNEIEYFAECSEAYFSSDRFRNDYFPFIKSELLEFDTAGYLMCGYVWEIPSNKDFVPVRSSSAISKSSTHLYFPWVLAMLVAEFLA